MPSGCRLSLLGRHGNVSVDIFHVAVSGLHLDCKAAWQQDLRNGEQEFHHLLAMKQDSVCILLSGL